MRAAGGELEARRLATLTGQHVEATARQAGGTL
jgi:hypothetical protein